MELKNQHHAGEKKATGEIRVEKGVAKERCGCSFHSALKIGELKFFVSSTVLLFWARQVLKNLVMRQANHSTAFV